jgi:hypothetical protein
VALTELREGLVGSPLQSVIEVITPSRGKPSHHGRVGGVSQNVYMDLAVRGKPRVAEAVQHVSKQGGKPEAVQPVNGTIHRLQGWRRGSHSSVENKGKMNQHFIHRTEPTNQTSKINHDDSKTLTLILFLAMTIS